MESHMTLHLADRFRESCFAKNHINTIELPDVTKVWIYGACDDSMATVTNANNGFWISVLRLHHIQSLPKGNPL